MTREVWARWPQWLPRLYLGLIFAIAAVSKVVAGVGFVTIFTRLLLAHVALEAGFPFYRALTAGVFLPHLPLFAGLVVVGEVYVAVAMLGGFTLRVAALVAIALLANYLCAKGVPPYAPSSNDAADIVLTLVVFGMASRKFTEAN